MCVQLKGRNLSKSPDIEIEKKPASNRKKSSRASFFRKATFTEPEMATEDDTARVNARFSQHIELQQHSTTYEADKQKLLGSERELAWDEPAKRSASEKEVTANQILIALREHERYAPDLFGNRPGEAIPSKLSRDMGGRFLVNKDRIDRSHVFKIAQQMPKGAHLHLHFNAELPAEVLLPHARSQAMQDTMFIRSTKFLLTAADFDDCEIVFDVLPQATAQGDIFSSTYDPNVKTKAHKDWSERTAWMLWREFRQRFLEFPENIYVENLAGNDEGLDRAEQWVRDKMIITQNKAYANDQTTNGVWACFNQGTRAFKGLLNYEGVYRWYIGHAIDSMIRDRVMYAELRPMLLDQDIPANDGILRLDHGDQMQIICEELSKKEGELREAGRLHLFPFGIKIIYCTPRSIPRERMRSELENCLKLKLRFPKLICGFDLVGAEDRPNNIGFYADLLLAFTNTCKGLGISIPFMFHAGESLLDTGGSHNPDNSNLYDSLLLSAKRIGHGYAILKHPTLVTQYKEQNICLELCPVSNEVLGLCSNIREHRFPELLAAGLHCTLNADNPGLFRGPTLDSKSLSYEFYQVLVGDPRMSIHGWKQLAVWSIEHSCLNDEEVLQLRATFDNEWEEFCQWVVEHYQAIYYALPGLN
ncbi:Putative adenosine deaminase domain, adenosine/adenine deaminase, metal-dependent hydrolase [Septoria linicola]|uniref:adenosine deaminase n=1 Tax=Septoria linicola TaxID=215465 RepID=A0A9Q9AEW8_9PEZI|nr:putative adenosine deaminase domain, adenosine/adenine deaminase, metal-dependent hydrolase [Septoria linicola]USW47840.1 Putative adenosine deaminase domain, adenosine/adenine deaminase, metal-dependent hydrolase [Septoria linicola]